MKVLGISFGRKNKNGDVLVKHALFAAKKARADVQFINAIGMKIGHCIACDYHGKAIAAGEVFPKCPLKDDYQILEDAVWDADGIIIGAPVYAVGPVGQFKNFLDRLCPFHDRALMIEENKKRKAAGKPELDPRFFKDRYIGYISTGGASTHNWVSRGLPTLALFTFSTCMKAVGHVDAYNMGTIGHPLLDANLMDTCADLGKTIAVSIGKPYDQVDTWIGKQGVCPVCHNSLIDLDGSGDGVSVECPICGIWGDASINNGKLEVKFSEAEKARARSTLAGVYEHYNEIHGFIATSGPKVQANKDFIEKEMEKYRHFDQIIAAM
ncbi:MAG: flavodoxin family protein [Treponema sp.]|jgi:multimeric flavodoxin WrbA|nr:flavodoxin family protein [Treponema sp.]